MGFHQRGEGLSVFPSHHASLVHQHPLKKPGSSAALVLGSNENGERRLDLVQLKWVCDALGFDVAELVRRWTAD